MIERLLLYGIDLKGCGGSIPETIESAVLVSPDETKPRLAVTDVAVPRAQVTVDTIVRLGFPPERFVKGGCGLEDLESRHNAQTSRLIISPVRQTSCSVDQVIRYQRPGSNRSIRGGSAWPFGGWRPNQRRTLSCGGISRKAGRIFVRQDRRLLCRGKFQSAIGCRGFSKAEGGTRRRRASRILGGSTPLSVSANYDERIIAV